MTLGDTLCAPRARHAKVHDLETHLGEHDVGGLQVAMDDTGAMRVFERRENLVDDVRGPVQRQRSKTIAQLLERLAAHELHHHHELRRRGDKVVDGGDAGVIDARQHRGFGLETPVDLGLDAIPIQDLESDIAAERFVDRLVDGAGCASPERADDPVLADRGA